MTRTIRVLGIAAVAVALTALAPGVAGAKTKKKKVHGTITIAHDKNASTGQDRFFGVLSAKNSRCVAGARVDLGFRPAIEGGTGSNFPRTVVASTHSDTRGNWQIFYTAGPNGTSPFSSFSASSPKRTLKTKRRGVLLVCKFATSSVITLATGGP